ncbi:hypothetical protein L596_021540 [Steinernema carpocapsae]|uniref:Uncharacterized protein n=1 Tax=Steinernema carpocapsae TaxID=34508 RepID=A0A4U5MJ39_STECR|nr:hypothetical protein L596_021540 [Steinernema carpocapsae]
MDGEPAYASRLASQRAEPAGSRAGSLEPDGEPAARKPARRAEPAGSRAGSPSITDVNDNYPFFLLVPLLATAFIRHVKVNCVRLQLKMKTAKRGHCFQRSRFITNFGPFCHRAIS